MSVWVPFRAGHFQTTEWLIAYSQIALTLSSSSDAHQNHHHSDEDHLSIHITKIHTFWPQDKRRLTACWPGLCIACLYVCEVSVSGVCVLVVMSTGQQTVLMSGIYVTTCFLLWECHKKFTNLLRTSVIRWPLVGWLWQFNCPLAGLNPRFMIRHYRSRPETIGQPKLPRVKLWTWVWIILRKTLQKKNEPQEGKSKKRKQLLCTTENMKTKRRELKKKLHEKKCSNWLYVVSLVFCLSSGQNAITVHHNYGTRLLRTVMTRVFIFTFSILKDNRTAVMFYWLTNQNCS